MSGNTVLGFIKINKKTEGHGDLLEKLGYTVHRDVEPQHFAVECTGFINETVDLTDHEVALDTVKGFIRDQKLISYKSFFKAIKNDGEETTLPGVHGARYLNQLVEGMSALVAKDEAPAKTSSTFTLDDLLDTDESDEELTDEDEDSDEE